MQQQWITSRSDCDVQRKVDFIRQPVMTSSVAGSRRSSKAPPKSQTCTKKKVHGHCLVVCCQSDPLQFSESQQNHYIWDVCSANWLNAPKTARPAAALINRKGPILHTTTQPHIAQAALQKLNELDYKIWPHLPYSPNLFQLITTSSSIWVFCRQNVSTTSRMQKMLSKSLSNPKA